MLLFKMSDQLRKEFLNEFTKDPTLIFAKSTLGILLKSHIQKFDSYLELISFKGLIKENIYQTLETIPEPKNNIGSILSYLVLVRLYLLQAQSNNGVQLDQTKVYSILNKKIPLTDLDILAKDYCSNIFFNIDPKSFYKGVSGAVGFLIGAPLGFLTGGAYLLSRPCIRQSIILSAGISAGLYVIKKGHAYLK